MEETFLHLIKVPTNLIMKWFTMQNVKALAKLTFTKHGLATLAFAQTNQVFAGKRQ